ncbi:MAG: hypothetical protein HYR85_16210 [Planctomycetes bacterium]|nr:hypothetical protein [Planctomycetota bacterium]
MKLAHTMAFALALVVAGVAVAHDQNTDRRKAGTSVDSGNGKMITITYFPRHYSDQAWNSLSTDESFRKRFNGMLPGFASLSTPVDLTIGGGTVPAGDYAMAGFQVSDKGEWWWIVKGADGKELAKLQLPAKDSGDKTEHLVLTLLPGDAPNSFTLQYHYGPKIATVTFTAGTAAATKKE